MARKLNIHINMFYIKGKWTQNTIEILSLSTLLEYKESQTGTYLLCKNNQCLSYLLYFYKMSWSEFIAQPPEIVTVLSLLFICSLLGLFGNGLSLLVLTRVKWQSSVIIMVLGLTISDSLILILELFSQSSATVFHTVRYSQTLLSAFPFISMLASIGM